MGYPPEMIKLRPAVPPPAGIRIQNSEGLEISGNTVDIGQVGPSGIDIHDLKESRVTGNRVRLRSKDRDRKD